MLELSLKRKITEQEARDLDADTKGSRPDGVYDLIWALCEGAARSYNESRIYYLAYLLSERNIEFVLREI